MLHREAFRQKRGDNKGQEEDKTTAAGLFYNRG
jgi:hypothetical protein